MKAFAIFSLFAVALAQTGPFHCPRGDYGVCCQSFDTTEKTCVHGELAKAANLALNEYTCTNVVEASSEECCQGSGLYPGGPFENCTAGEPGL